MTGRLGRPVILLGSLVYPTTHGDVAAGHDLNLAAAPGVGMSVEGGDVDQPPPVAVAGDFDVIGLA